MSCEHYGSAGNCTGILRRLCPPACRLGACFAGTAKPMAFHAIAVRSHGSIGRSNRWVRSYVRGAKNPRHRMMSGIFGDPYGNRTHITAVKGRCLNLLTNGPGSGNLTRTDDNTGMNRVLYQLSYAARFNLLLAEQQDELYRIKRDLSSMKWGNF